jgi:hypothetical protein
MARESFVIIPDWAVELPPYGFAVFCVLAPKVERPPSRDGLAQVEPVWRAVAVDDLALQVGCSGRTVQRYLRRLVSVGAIEVLDNPGGPTWYRTVRERPEALS